MFTKKETNKIKGIAILFLVFHHMYRTVDDIAARGVELHVMTADNVSKLAYCMRICVYIFALLTAYGIALQYETIKKENRSTFKFLFKRWIKLLAPFWFTLLCIWIVYLVVPGLDPLETYRGGNIVGLMFGEFFALLDVLGYSYNMIASVAWYMDFAVLEILAIPILYILCEKFGGATLLLTSAFYNFIPTVFCSDFCGDYNCYIFAIEVGILLAQQNILSEIHDSYVKWKVAKRIGYIFLLVLIMIGTPYMAWFVIKRNMFGVWGILFTTGASACVLISYLAIRGEIVETILTFLGRYSGDIFLTHTLIYSHLSSVIFRSKNILIQYITCVAICVLVSFLLSKLKQYTRYNKMISWLCKKIDD